MPSTRLLVVEDEVLVARDIKARLTKMGYEVVDMAARGEEAVEKALSHRPDLVLMDINLRDEVDGVDAAIRIREQYDVPVIFCTAYSNEDTLERAKVSEPYGYVLKPFDNRELEINIEIALYKHRVERDLADTRRRLDATLTNVSDGVIAAEVDGCVRLINPPAEKITGWSRGKVGQVTLPQIMKLEPFEAGGPLFDPACATEGLPDGETFIRQYLRQPSGEMTPIELSVNTIENHFADLVVLTFRDISQQIRYEEQIRHNAFFDGLTGLPNRALFFDRLESSMNRRARGNTQPFAVAFVDLDKFAVVNEGLGHDTGDRVIDEIGRRLDHTVRPDDTLSRFSGDVFAVLLDPVDSVNGAITAVARMQAAIEKPIELESTTINLTASAGILLYDGSYTSPEEMIRDADTALHRAKGDARGTYAVFDNAMYENALKYIECRRGIQAGLVEDEFEVHYQPIVDARSGSLVSMEALVRWNHPERGYVSPAEFIPVAEETGLILPLGEWVLGTVCDQVAQWQAAGLDGPRVAVNLSARQFDDNVPKAVARLLEQSDISPDLLSLEITEGIAMKNVERNIRMLNELRFLGLSISIDDFGTGYSSLAYLKRFPLNTLKIDRSFIKDITTNDEDREITRAIIAMGQNLRLTVLAEGVETSEQLEMLREDGCDLIQGFYFSKPLPAAQMTCYLEHFQRPKNASQGNNVPPSTSSVAPVI